MNCPFCNVNTKRTRVVYEGKYCKVLFSDPRLMPCHLLVVPKRHVEKLKDLNSKEREEFWKTVDLYCDKILKFAEGYTLKNNFMPFLPQGRLKVDHLHVHIWPRNLKDDMYTKVLYNDSLLWKDLDKKEIIKYEKLLNS